MKKSQKIFIGVSLALVGGALIGAPLAALYVALSPKELAPYLLFPQRTANCYQKVDLKPFGVSGEQVNIPISGGGHLTAFYFPRPKAKYTVLLSHGQGPLQYQLGVAHAALAANLNVLIYDYQGYGTSSGTPSTGNLLNDGLSAFDYLVQSRKINPKNIIDIGCSLGTGIASHIASKRECGGVLLVAPYASLAQAAQDNIQYFKIYPRYFYPKPDLSCLPLMESKQKEPIVIIHGTRDLRIPVYHSRKLATVFQENHKDAGACKNLRYLELPSCGHGDIPMQTITDELKGIVKHLDGESVTASKAVISYKN